VLDGLVRRGDTPWVARASPTVRLFGRFELRSGGEMRPLDSARAESALALVLLHGGEALSRRHVASMLWPDSTEAQARTNLRHVLHTLRRAWADVEHHVDVTGPTLRRRPDSPLELDVAAFDRLLDARSDSGGAGDGERRMEVLREALTLYRGDLLEDVDDEWLLPERDRLRCRVVDALAELVTLCEQHGAVAEALSRAQRLLRLDPLREETYRQLMRLHDADGDRTGAVRVFHVCSSTLDRELAIPPSPATRAAYEALLRPRQHLGAEPVDRTGVPLVGRRTERSRLVELWRSAESGTGRLVLVRGEAGVGKTRLTEELAAWCAHRGARVAEARCYPADGPLAYGPVADWLRGDALRLPVRRADPAAVSEIARLLPEVLVERPDAPRPLPLPENEQRHRLFDACATTLLGDGRPALLVLDDAQHVDRETCRLLHYLLRARARLRLLVVGTARPEDVEPDHPLHGLLTGLRALDRLEEVELARLDRAETTTLAERVAGVPFARAEAAALHDETEGNPLFIIEALRAGWPTEQPLSSRVQAVIETRLARLTAPAREIAALAALIGRDFDVDVLRAAADVGDDTLADGLDELWRRHIVRARVGAGTYDFSHGKIRQVIGDAVAPARRRRLHRRIAVALEQVHAADLEPVSARLAAHHEHAGDTARAVAWCRRAARAAMLLHARHDAVRLLRRGLDLLATQPATAGRDMTELELRIDLLAPLVEVAGYASSLMERTQGRALALAETLGLEPSPPLWRSVALSALTRSDFAETTRVGDRLRLAAESAADPVLEVEASYVLGIAAFWQGELPAARSHFERAVERYRPENRTSHLVHYAQDPKVVCLGRLANTLWFLGHGDDARRAAADAVGWADEIAHPFSRTIAHTFAAVLALDMGDDGAVREHAAHLARAPEENVSLHVVEAFRGYLAALDGHGAAGIRAVREAVSSTGAVGPAPGQQALLLRVLLATCRVAGDSSGACDAADRLLALGGAARNWAPLARRVLAEAAPSDGGTAAERSGSHPPSTDPRQEDP
jgi:DNA-binding SARP family transcriptional activator/tetratricopeptide (TPR) repeat protein